MADDVKVVSSSSDAMQDANGRYINAIKVEFRVGSNGPFFVKIPQTEFTAARVREETDKVAREIAQLPR